MTTGNPGADDGAQVLDDVFKSGRDSGAESAAPEVKDEPAVEAKAEAPEPETQVETEEPSPQGRDPRTGRFVPVSELVEERKKLRAEREEEMRLRVAAEERAKFYEAQFQQFQRQPQREPVQQQRPVEIPDPIQDPQGYARFLLDHTEQQLINDRVNLSEDIARQTHGDKAVDEALNAAHQVGVAPRFQNHRNPFGALMQWYRQAKTLQEIGPDPDAYKTKLRDSIRTELLAELKAGKLTPNGQAQTPPARMPGTLADATGMGSQGALPVDPQRQLDDIFASGRRRRAG